MRAVPMLGDEPTVVVSAANAASSIAGSTLTRSVDPATGALDADPFRYFGANIGWSGVGWPYGVRVKNSLSDTHFVMPYSVEFMCDADVLEAWVTGANGSARLWVDGVRGESFAMPGDGQVHYIIVTFGSAASRRIRFDLWQPSFGGIRVGPGYIVSAIPDEPVTRAVFMGDSYVCGVSCDYVYEGFVWTCGETLGWRDAWMSGSGGTGYLNGGLADQFNFRERVQADVIAWSPDVVVVCGGINDSAFAAAQVGAEAALLFAAIRAGLRDARLIVTSGLGNGEAPAGQTEALRAAAASAGAEFIDVAGESWFTGTGNTGAPNGTGNNDVYFGTASHPPKDGHDYLGTRLAFAISPPATGLDF